MRQISSKKFLLIVVFAIFSIVSTSLNYCFGAGDIYYNTKLYFCPDCGLWEVVYITPNPA